MRWLGIVVIAGLLLPGCASLIIQGGTEGATIVAQERSPGDAVNDAAIYVSIKKRFADKDFADLLMNVDVKVVEGRVLLTGNVDKVDSQIDAVRLVWQVGDVKEVINEVQINDQADFVNYAQDVAISTQVRTRLLLEEDVRSVNYSAITVNQTVYLMGIAQDEGELRHATSVAATTNYVKRVVSYVMFKNDPRRKDAGKE